MKVRANHQVQFCGSLRTILKLRIRIKNTDMSIIGTCSASGSLLPGSWFHATGNSRIVPPAFRRLNRMAASKAQPCNRTSGRIWSSRSFRKNFAPHWVSVRGRPRTERVSELKPIRKTRRDNGLWPVPTLSG